MTIRLYADKDEAQVLAIVRDLQAHEGRSFDRMKPPAAIGSWYIAMLKSWCEREDGVILVAEEDGEVVGYATVMTRVEEEGEGDEVPYTYAYVGDLAVLASHRGRGIGRRLLQECERRARAAGRRWLRIEVLAGNSRAQALYRRFGFADHLVAMEKPLS